MLDAVADMQLHRAVVASQWDGDRHLFTGGLKHAAHSVVEAEELDRLGELRPCIGEGVRGEGMELPPGSVGWISVIRGRCGLKTWVGEGSGLVSERLLEDLHAFGEQLVRHGHRWQEADDIAVGAAGEQDQTA